MPQEKYRAKPKNPAPRKAPAQKAQLSPEERRRLQAKRKEEMRRLAEEKAHRAALRRRRRKMLFRLSFILSLVFVFAYWIWVALSISNRPSDADQALPLYLFTEGERKEDAILEPEEVFFNQNVYLPVTKLEEYMAISQFGDHITRSFLIPSSGEYATFYLGSEEAVINGQAVSLKAPAFLKDEVLYLPADFYAEKMNCFTYSESVAAYGANVLTFTGESPSFLFHSFPPSPPVDPATIPVFTPPPEEPTA